MRDYLVTAPVATMTGLYGIAVVTMTGLYVSLYRNTIMPAVIPLVAECTATPLGRTLRVELA